MVRINLLPAEIVERRKYERFYPLIFAIGAVLLIAVLLTWLGVQFVVGQKVAQLQQTEETISTLNAQASALSIFQEQQQALESRQQVAQVALASRCDMGKIMEEISLVLPEPLWIEQLLLNQDTGMTMKGQTPDAFGTQIDEGYKSVAAGLVRINSLEDLYDVWLTRASSGLFADFQGGVEGDAKAVGFEMTAKIAKPDSQTQQSAVPAPPATADQ